MKYKDILPAIEDMAGMYVERLRPIIEQAISNGAIWGSLNMPVADEIKKEVLKQALESPQFKRWGDDSIRELAEKDWPSTMLFLQNLRTPRDEPRIENWDEKSAYEGFIAGALFACSEAVKRLEEICKIC